MKVYRSADGVASPPSGGALLERWTLQYTRSPPRSDAFESFVTASSPSSASGRSYIDDISIYKRMVRCYRIHAWGGDQGMRPATGPSNDEPFKLGHHQIFFETPPSESLINPHSSAIRVDHHRTALLPAVLFWLFTTCRTLSAHCPPHCLRWS